MKKYITNISLFLRREYAVHYWRFCFIVFSFLILFTYFGVWGGYFVQDEWYYFGLFNQFNNPFLGIIQTFLQSFTHPNLYSVHFTPLWNSIFFLEYTFFGLQYSLYAFFGLLLHLLTSLLVIILGLKISRNRLLSFLAGIFFAVSQSHMEAVTWANTHLQTQIPSILVIGSILLWIKGITYKSKRAYIVSMGFLFCALFIKETVFGTFFLLGILFFLFKTSFDTKKAGYTILTISFFVYGLIRGLIPVIMKHFDTTLNTGPSIPNGIFAIGPQIYRLINFPIKALVQLYVPVDFINFMGEQITRWNYPAYAKQADIRGIDFLTFSQSAGADIVMIYIGFLFLALVIFVYFLVYKQKNLYIKQTFLFSILFIFFSVLPHLLIAPWLATLFSFVTFLDSRHFYLISIGGSLLFGLAATTFLNSAKTKHIKLAIISVIILILGINVFSVLFVNWTKTIPTGAVRKSIVQKITKSYKTIPDRAIFYIRSDTPYYGFANPMPPFQNNFGETLLDVYQKTSHFPPEFFTQGFLIRDGLLGEGYKESKGKGFGYFLTGSNLFRTIASRNISPNIVYAFDYKGDTNETINISQKVREDIKNLLESKKTIKTWKNFEDKEIKFKFYYPENYQLSQESIDTSQDILWEYSLQKDGQKAVEIIVNTNNRNGKSLDIESFVLEAHDSQGNPLKPLGPTFTRPSMLFDSIEGVTVIRAEEKNEVNIYIPPRFGSYVKQIRLLKGAALDGFPLEKFYRTIQFDY